MLRLGMRLLQTGSADITSRLQLGDMKGENAVRAYTGDMLAVERHILATAEKQLLSQSVKEQPVAVDLITKIKEVAERHVEALEQEVMRTGGTVSSGFKASALSFLSMGVEKWQALRTERVSKVLRDYYTVLSLTSVSYSMLETTALVFRDAMLAEVAARHMKDVTPLLTEISEVIPVVTARDYKAHAQFSDEEVSEQVVRDVREAWSSEAIHTGHGHAEAA